MKLIVLRGLAAKTAPRLSNNLTRSSTKMRSIIVSEVTHYINDGFDELKFDEGGAKEGQSITIKITFPSVPEIENNFQIEAVYLEDEGHEQGV